MSNYTTKLTRLPRNVGAAPLDLYSGVRAPLTVSANAVNIATHLMKAVGFVGAGSLEFSRRGGVYQASKCKLLHHQTLLTIAVIQNTIKVMMSDDRVYNLHDDQESIATITDSIDRWQDQRLTILVVRFSSERAQATTLQVVTKGFGNKNVAC